MPGRFVYCGPVDSRREVLTDLHILVVEDDADGREILKSLLGYFGAFVSTAHSAGDAMRTLRAITPDVVIVDMVLGRRSGFDVVQQAGDRVRRVPFIAVSAQDFDPQELERAGFAAFLRKPLDHNELVDTIRSVLLRRRLSA